ncbi:hypothetical protein M758_12G120600 [Ceratodon purpureus]|nr:hypothetical protein M758_12G120600 [Ceratodon purpureus]
MHQTSKSLKNITKSNPGELQKPTSPNNTALISTSSRKRNLHLASNRKTTQSPPTPIQCRNLQSPKQGNETYKRVTSLPPKPNPQNSKRNFSLPSSLDRSLSKTSEYSTLPKSFKTNLFRNA